MEACHRTVDKDCLFESFAGDVAAGGAEIRCRSRSRRGLSSERVPLLSCRSGSASWLAAAGLESMRVTSSELDLAAANGLAAAVAEYA